MRKQAITRLWLSAFVAVAALTVFSCSYYEGRTDEALRQNRELDQIVDQAIAQRDAAQARYDALAKAAGEGAILEAGIEYQREREGR